MLQSFFGAPEPEAEKHAGTDRGEGGDDARQTDELREARANALKAAEAEATEQQQQKATPTEAEAEPAAETAATPGAADGGAAACPKEVPRRPPVNVVLPQTMLPTVKLEYSIHELTARFCNKPAYVYRAAPACSRARVTPMFDAGLPKAHTAAVGHELYASRDRSAAERRRRT